MTCPVCGKDNFKWAKRCDHGIEHLAPAEREAQVQALSNRMRSILAGRQKPEWVFICNVGNGGTLCLPPVNGETSLLLFTSPLLALDYLRAIGDRGEARAVPIDAITELPRGWPELGVHSFCLNRCPRCKVVTAFLLDALTSLDSFLSCDGRRSRLCPSSGTRAAAPTRGLGRAPPLAAASCRYDGLPPLKRSGAPTHQVGEPCLERTQRQSHG